VNPSIAALIISSLSFFGIPLNLLSPWLHKCEPFCFGRQLLVSHSLCVGLHFPTDDWPRFEVTGYLRAIDFNARFSHEQIIRQYGPYPKLGGGQGVPLQGLVKIVSQPVTN
jgi:hypothetical protein